MPAPFLLAEFSPQSLLVPAAIVAISLCAATWAWIAARWRQRRPVAPYQPRRPAPWQAVDLALVVLFYTLALSGAMRLRDLVLGPGAAGCPTACAAGKSSVEHVVGQLAAEGNPWILALCFISAAVVTPVAEEFFFRVLLQGWMESLEHRWRRRMPLLRRIVPRGAGPVALGALLFALLHFRVETPQMAADVLVFQQAADAVAKLLTIGFAVELVRRRVGATAADLGWTPGKLWGDVKLGLAAFAAVVPPIYGMQCALHCLLPKHVAPDPLPVFVLALALGLLYYRTHRIVPLVVLHALLNATSLTLVWLGSQS